MKVSELINELQVILADRGDLEISNDVNDGQVIEEVFVRDESEEEGPAVCMITFIDAEE